MSNPAFRLILRDFNCRSNSSWEGNISTNEVSNLESVSSSHLNFTSLSQIQHIIPKFSSCIGLIFNDQSNLVIDIGVHSSLHVNSTIIAYCKLNLKIVFPSPYECLVWNYKEANNTEIRKARDLVNWDFIFLIKTVHEQVFAFNHILMNIFNNYLPNKYKSFDGQDPP